MRDEVDETLAEVLGRGVWKQRLLGWRPLLAWLLPGLMALVVALPSLSGPYVLDDQLTVASHPIVVGKAPLTDVACYNHLGQLLPRCGSVRGSSLQQVGSKPSLNSKGVGPTWRPLSTLLFRLQWFVLGGSPRALRSVAALGFALVCLLLMALMRRLGVALLPACLGATLFAALAIHVDALALSNSSESWALALVLSTLLAVLAGRPLSAAALFVFALGFKESAIVLPALVAWLVPWHRVPRWRWALVLCTSVALGYLLLRAQVVPLGIAGWTSAADNPLLGQPLLSRWATSIALLGRYVVLTVVPQQLAFDYSYAVILPGEDISVGYLVSGLVVLGLLVWALIASWRRRVEDARWALLGYCAGAFVIAFALPSNAIALLPIIFAERLFFAASLWLVLGVVVIGVIGTSGRRRLGRVLVVLAALAVLLQGTLAVRRSALWSEPLQLLAAQVRVSPASVKGQLYYARGLAAAKQPGRALWHLALAMQGRQRFPAAWRPRSSGQATADALLERIPGMLAPRAPPALVWRRLAVAARQMLGADAAQLALSRARLAAHGPSRP